MILYLSYEYNTIVVMGYIYLVTNLINDMKYVGQTCCKNIESRWKAHKSCRKGSLGNYIYNAYKKYGVGNFKFQIICICFDEDCDRFETEYIQKFNTLYPNGYNLKEGGLSSKHHETTKKLMSEKAKIAMTDERKQKLSEHNRGKLISESQKITLREKQIHYWANLTDEHREKISQERKARFKGTNMREKCLAALEKNRCKKSKKVGKYTMNNDFIESYISINEAAIKNGITHSSISKTCRGVDKYKSAGGFKWKYIEDIFINKSTPL